MFREWFSQGSHHEEYEREDCWSMKITSDGNRHVRVKRQIIELMKVDFIMEGINVSILVRDRNLQGERTYIRYKLACCARC
jgi:hypothetical protein